MLHIPCLKINPIPQCSCTQVCLTKLCPPKFWYRGTWNGGCWHILALKYLDHLTRYAMDNFHLCVVRQQAPAHHRHCKTAHKRSLAWGQGHCSVDIGKAARGAAFYTSKEKLLKNVLCICHTQIIVVIANTRIMQFYYVVPFPIYQDW